MEKPLHCHKADGKGGGWGGKALLDFDFYKYWKLHENYAKMIEVVYATVSYGVFISGCG